ASTKMSKNDVEKAVKEAEKFAEEDRKTKERIEVRNEADSVVYNVENMLKEQGEKIDKSDKENIEKSVAATKEALKGEDLDKIRAAKDELLKASHKLAEQMYRSAAAKQNEQGANAAGGAPGANGGSNGAAGEQVVDAEIVDEGKK